jgi:aminoglycoside phosphotransferase (APT) family kinase protein
VYILDFEVMHVGNPVFDLAFILAHLLCKFFHAPNAQEAAELSNIAKTFLIAYEEQTEISASLVLHTALIALARVEGKSLVNYLSNSEQEKIQLLTKQVLFDRQTPNVLTLFDMSKR